MDYQAKLTAPFGMLGIRCCEEALTAIVFLPASETPQLARNGLAEEICRQLRCYFENPDAKFSIPLKPVATAHQRKVWDALLTIPRGQTKSYGELAATLHSGAQAVGQACGANPVPIVIPCHRVVSRAGLGGFMKHADGAALEIKRWLLAHEQR